jgi:thiol-disulfide isomerase/thioredoxin
MKAKNLLVGAVLAIAIGAPIAGLLGDMKGQPMTPAWIPFLHGLPAGQAPGQAALASLERSNAWLNSPPLRAGDLRGKVVLVDFWTYTCINWLRTLPYVRAWAQKYKDKGLVVIGVHSPEFSFEKNPDNVHWAVKALRVDYPVAVDSEHVIWRAFDNQYWPALYFIDSQGRVRHQDFGEGEYDQSEMIIRRLLTEAGVVDMNDDLVSVEAGGLEAAADWSTLRSPENYVGYERYRWRLGLAEGEPKFDALEKKLAAAPVITVPTITMEGDANGAPHPEPSAYANKFSGPYEHRNIAGGIGHNLPQEAPEAFAQAVVDVGGL